MNPVIGLYAEPLVNRRANPYWRAIRWRANPRPREYMAELFAEVEPTGEMLVADKLTDLDGIFRRSDRVVLLYPDPIGLGWLPLERQILRNRPGGVTLEVLNGRRRGFVFDRRTHVRLLWRRALSLGMVGEAIVAPIILGLGPVLWLYDRLKGRH